MKDEYLLLKELESLLEADKIKYDVINKDIYYYQNGKENKYYYYDLINDIDKEKVKINKSSELYKVLMAIHQSAMHREFKNEIIKYYLNNGETMPKHVFIEEGELLLPIDGDYERIPVNLLVNKSIEILISELGLTIN